MISRRLIRIKAMQAMYAYRQIEEKDKKSAHISLLFNKSIDNLQSGYLHSLQLLKALDYFLLSEIDIEMAKYFPDKERIRRFKILANNKLIQVLDNSKSLEKAVTQYDVTWDDEGETLELFLKNVIEKDFVKDYLVFDEPEFKVAKNFIKQLLDFALIKSKDLNEALSNKVISWHDDKRMVMKAVEETIKGIDNADTVLELHNFKDNAQAEVDYGQDLIDFALENQESILKEVQSLVKNWDMERIALIDQVIVLLAASEFLNFPDIPVKVSINEYLEVAKVYSTPQSSKFINGVLDSLKNKYQKEDRIIKNEKGLRDN